MIKRRTVLLAGVSLVPVGLLAGCGGGDAVGTRLRLVNASRTYTPLDLWLDDDREIENVAYGQGSDYENVDRGNTDVKLTVAGSSGELLEQELDIQAEEPQTILAYGSTGGGAQMALLAEDRDEHDVDDDEAWFRVFNAAPDAGAVDIYLTVDIDDLDNTSADVAVAAYGEATEYLTVDSGTYRLRITEAGDKDEVRLDVPALELSEGRIYTLVVTPSVGGVMVDALLLPQERDVVAAANTIARVRMASSVEADVSVSIGGDVVAAVDGLSISRYRSVAAGAATATITVDGVAMDFDVSLQAGTDTTLLFDGHDLVALADDNTLPTPVEDQAAVRLVNAVDGLAGGLSMTVASEPVASGVAEDTASERVEVDARTNVRIVVRGPASDLEWTLDDENLDAGSVYSVFVLGSADEPDSIDVQLVKDR